LSTGELSTDFFEVVEKRRSIRKFKSEAVPVKDLKRILEAGRLAPSGSNRQPWHFIVVRDPETKKSLSIAADNQKFVADADAVIVALGDPSALVKPQARFPTHKFSLTRTPHRQDPMIAVEHMVLAATALGYGACWIGAFDESEVEEILRVPENLEVIVLLPVGVPDENPRARRRKAFTKVFFKELYGVPLEL
jgi:nitroreductase